MSVSLTKARFKIREFHNPAKPLLVSQYVKVPNLACCNVL